MRKLLFIIILAMTTSCESYSWEPESKPDQQEETPPVAYDPTIHHLGNESDWNQIQFKIQYITSDSSVEITNPIKDRSPSLQPAYVLNSLHTWFTTNAGYKIEYSRDLTLFVLNRIPARVLSEILSRTSPTLTPFAILNQQFWRGINQLQENGYIIGFIADYDVPIAGLNIGERLLIAFDILANSGTMVHELRHQAQYNSITHRKPRYWGAISSECKERISHFFAELDATTTQMPIWSETISAANIHIESLEEIDRFNENSNHGTPIPLLVPALSANLEYPISQSGIITTGDEKKYWWQSLICPKKISDSISAIGELVSAQKKNIMTLKSVRILFGSLRATTVLKLKKWENMCQPDNSSAECQALEAELISIKQKVNDAKREVAGSVAAAYRERTLKIPTLFSEVDYSKKEISELCNEVMGFKLLLADRCKGF